MKRILSLILTIALLLSAFAGCSSDTETLKDNPDNTPTGISSDVPETEPDYSWFEMPEETDTLVLYSGSWTQADIYQKAIPIFKNLYPGVEVELKNMGDEEYVNTLRTEIPAGKGPDLVLGTSFYDLRDVYKTMEARVFDDLNPYIVVDDDFSLDDYIKGIMNAGVFKGERVVLPFSHRPMILTTSAELLAEEAITAEDLTDFDRFVAVCEHYRGTHPGKFFMDEGLSRLPEDQQLTLFRELFLYSGIQFFDYENRTVVLNREELKKLCDFIQLYDPATVESERTAEEKKKLKSLGTWDLILKRKCLFYSTQSAGLSLMMTRYTVAKKGETPVTVVMPDISGAGCTEINFFIAIPKGAKNKLNAWRFLKVLMSDEIQGDSEKVMSIYSPVLIRATKEIIEAQGYPDEEIDALAQSLDAIDRAYMLPPVQWIYLRDHMMPYLTGERDFDVCYGDLLRELELYIDE